ncbi:MAG: hypothetical protein AVDCRST_MAG51-2960, partial [uncultured Ramlibacter sp.]
EERRHPAFRPRGNAGAALRGAPCIFFHPDCDRRPQHWTGSADPAVQRRTAGARGLTTFVAYRRWGFPPRPEDRSTI